MGLVIRLFSDAEPSTFCVASGRGTRNDKKRGTRMDVMLQLAIGLMLQQVANLHRDESLEQEYIIVV